MGVFDIERALGIDTGAGQPFLVPGALANEGRKHLFKVTRSGTLVTDNQSFLPEQSSYNYVQASNKISFLGTPVVSNLEIPSGTYTNLKGVDVDFEGLRIDTVLFTVSQTKNIIKTPIMGKNGTVKEYISDGDYVITGSAIIIGETNEGSGAGETNSQGGAPQILSKTDIGNNYPSRDVKRFIEICKVPRQIQVFSAFLGYWDISHVVIEAYDVPQEKGVSNYQVVSFSMVSDIPIELLDIEQDEI
jgi:hypothetical protein